MKARFHDGLTARAVDTEVKLAHRLLAFEAEGALHRWPLTEIRVEPLGERVRLAKGATDPARLTLEAKAWTAAARAADPGFFRRRGKVESQLVLGLTALSAGVAGFVFIVLPAISGPLARGTPPALERRIGDNFDAQLSIAFRPCTGQTGQDALYVFGDRLEGAARTPFNIRVRAVHAPIANAFALPGGAILVTDKLIELARTPDELSAVIAHEAAHVEKRHAMQAVWRSLGFGLLLDAVVGGGSGGGQQAVLLAGSFTDLRYSRDAEAEADARGQALLQAEGLSSQGMAPFFERLAAKGEGADAAAVKELLSDHPDTLRRAQLSRARAKPGEAAFTAADWRGIKDACKGSTGGPKIFGS